MVDFFFAIDFIIFFMPEAFFAFIADFIIFMAMVGGEIFLDWF